MDYNINLTRISYLIMALMLYYSSKAVKANVDFLATDVETTDDIALVTVFNIYVILSGFAVPRCCGRGWREL